MVTQSTSQLGTGNGFFLGLFTDTCSSANLLDSIVGIRNGRVLIVPTVDEIDIRRSKLVTADQRTVCTLWSLKRMGLRCEGLYDERQSEGLMIILEQGIVCQCQSLLVI